MEPRMRRQGWAETLAGKIRADHNRPFEWGAHDCCLFAADTILALTGEDVAADVRGTYSTAMEAARILKAKGGVRGVASSALGQEIPPLMAQRGDIVLVQTEAHGDTLAVCIGEHCVAPGADGLQRMAMTKAVTAWRVASCHR